MMMDTWAACFDNICERWNLTPQQRQKLMEKKFPELTPYLMEISIGLEALYGDKAETERKWLTERHAALYDEPPLDIILAGDLPDLLTVVEQLRYERGLADEPPLKKYSTWT